MFLKIILLYAFLRAVDEELEMKPKKRRKRTRELPKEDSSDDGNVQVPTDVNTFYITKKYTPTQCHLLILRN